MRLLKCNSTDEFSFKVFVGDDIPRYAILSHTWGAEPEEEVTFEDLMNGIGKDKTGYNKIQFCGKQARCDDLQYFWVDTCCINKANNTELSEAINSMFHWYQNASKCYVYLSDVSISKRKASDQSSQFTWESAFPPPKWFTRGWTLQEMIAPRELEFYDKDWKFMGSKTDRLHELHRITGVDPMVLQGGNLRLISVARKMSWASNRKTTRPEDRAYSLLGLFGISMPMLYGEGSRAFIRLQEEIVKEYDDETLFAWRSSTAANYTGLFAQSPADFAKSGNIFPCQSTSRQIEPVLVSSRGLRINACLQRKKEKEEFADPTYLMRLNCKEVHFNMKPKERIGIVVATPFGIGNVYARTESNDLPKFQPKSKSEWKIVFALKENHIKEFELVENYGFWIRTIPLWQAPQTYRLDFAHPEKFWCSRNNMFRRGRQDKDERPFVLVYRKDAGTNKTQHSYFMVFLGVKELSRPIESWSRDQMWCSVKFRHAPDLKAEDLDQEVEKLDRENIVAQIKGQRDRFARDEGEGVTLKCYVQLEVVCGQHLFCADLHTQEITGSKETIGNTGPHGQVTKDPV